MSTLNIVEFSDKEWKVAEDRVFDWLKSKWSIVIDLRNETWAREMDVDFQTAKPDLKPFLWDVKAERNTDNTGNIAVEVVSNITKGTPGCYLLSKAHYIAHVSTGVAEWHLRVIELRPFIAALNAGKFQRCQMIVSGTGSPNRQLYGTLSILVPLSMMQPYIVYRGMWHEGRGTFRQAA